MKTQIFFIIFMMGFTQFINAQLLISCGDEPLAFEIRSNNLFFDTGDCENNLTITVDENNLSDNEDVYLEGDIEIQIYKTIYIIGNKNHAIYLKPPNTTNSSETSQNVVFAKKALPDESKTRVRTSQQESKSGGIEKKSEDSEITLYPNPVDTNLTIETNETILSYSISNTYGILQTQGNTPNNNVISVSSLQTGLYYLTLQTNSQIITKTFYKN